MPGMNIKFTICIVYLFQESFLFVVQIGMAGLFRKNALGKNWKETFTA
jgi:hypothetical protein